MLKGKNKLKKYNLNVGLIAPARGTNIKKLSLAKKRLEFMGVKSINHRENILEKKFDYWAGDLDSRLLEMHEMFENKNINLIWCLNGGISSLELISKLDFEKIKQNKKLFIGYSDITSLQNAFLHYAKLETIQFHMPGVKNWFNNKKEVSMLKNLLEFKDNRIEILSTQIFSPGKCSNQIVGGCLSLLCSSLGTPHEIDTKDKILYLEDTNCTPQRLFNDLCHLYLAGKFDFIKGLVLSKMANCGNYSRFLDLFLEKLSGKNIPIIKELDAGHHKFKIPIVIGGKCSINTEEFIISFGFSETFKKEMGFD